MVRKGEKILVIRLSALGDVAMTVPTLIALGRRYPDNQVYVLTREFFTPIFDRLPHITVIPLHPKTHHKGIRGLYRLALQIKKIAPVHIADLHNVLRTNILKFILRGSQIPFEQIDKGRSEKKQLTRPKNKKWVPLKATHQRYVEVFQRLGYEFSMDPSCILPNEGIPRSAQSILGKEPKHWVGIAPFAAHSGKVYPEEQMKTVIRILARKGGIIPILFGSKEEQPVLENWCAEIPGAITVAGKLSFSEELALISNLDIMVSMDSGNGHLAAMYGIPVLTLWGVTHPYLGFRPFGQPENYSFLPDLTEYPEIPTSVYGNKYPPGYEKVMDGIRPERITDKITNLLQAL